MSRLVSLCVIVCVLITLPNDVMSDLKERRAQREDPNAMFGPKTRGHRTNRNLNDDDKKPEAPETPPSYDKPDDTELVLKLEDVEKQLTKCETEMIIQKSVLEKCENRTQQCQVLKELPFFKHYILSLLKELPKLLNADHIEGHYVMDILLTTEQVEYLSKYVNAETGSVQEVHEILTSSLSKNIRWVENDPAASRRTWIDWDKFTSRVGVIVQILISVAVSVHVLRIALQLNLPSLKTVVIYVIIFSLLMSLPWTWWYMYQKKLVEREVEMLKSNTCLESCKNGRNGIHHRIIDFFSGSSDECTKCYEKIMIDPMWEITPLTVVSRTLTLFILEPAGHVGEAIRLLLTRTFEGLPFHLWVPALAMIVLILVLCLFCGFNYRFKTIFFSLEPDRPVQPDQNPALENRLRQDLLRLQEERDQLDRRLEASIRQLEDRERAMRTMQLDYNQRSPRHEPLALQQDYTQGSAYIRAPGTSQASSSDVRRRNLGREVDLDLSEQQGRRMVHLGGGDMGGGELSPRIQPSTTGSGDGPTRTQSSPQAVGSIKSTTSHKSAALDTDSMDVTASRSNESFENINTNMEKLKLNTSPRAAASNTEITDPLPSADDTISRKNKKASPTLELGASGLMESDDRMLMSNVSMLSDAGTEILDSNLSASGGNRRRKSTPDDDDSDDYEIIAPDVHHSNN